MHERRSGKGLALTVRSGAEGILAVIERLGQQFPEVPVEEIQRAVHGHYASFSGHPIRNFVPILVGRANRQRLSDYRRSSPAHTPP
jgi:hypothetical protein